MNRATSVKKTAPYTTWYEFKKDLEKSLNYPLLNWYWLDIKPKCPLPWEKAHMKACLSALVGSRHN